MGTGIYWEYMGGRRHKVGTGNDPFRYSKHITHSGEQQEGEQEYSMHK